MSVFFALFLKELGFWFRRPGVHLFAALFFSLGLMSILAMGGSIEFIHIGGAGGLKKADAVSLFTEITLVWGLFATMNLAAAAGGAATRDVTEGSHPLVYSTPVPKLTFLASRYLGALAVSTYLVAMIPMGLFLGRLLPVLEAERIGAFDPLATLACIVTWQGPNLIFVTSLFFAIGAVTRRMFPIYIGGVFLFVGYLGSSAFTADLDDQWLAVMLDPFGLQGMNDVTRYWSPEESNTLIPWPTGRALASRVLWTSIGLAALMGSTFLTRLDQHGWQPLARFTRKPDGSREIFDESLAVPVVARDFGPAARLAQVRSLARRAVLDVVGHRYFWGFVGASVLFQLLNAQSIGAMYGTDTLPVTYQVVNMLFGTLQLFVLMVLTFYAGDLVWAERDNGQAQLLDSAPIPDGAFLTAKLLALGVLVVALHAIPFVLGPLVQLASGYTQLEPSLYVQAGSLALLGWVPYVALTLAVHVVLNNKMLGHSAIVGFWILQIFRSALGFEHNLFWFGSSPGRLYSDMNGWGHTLGGYFVHKLYWVAFAVVLVGIARLFWVRGTRSWRERLPEAVRRFDWPTRALIGGGAAVWLALGTYIAVQTNLVGTYQTSVDVKRLMASYETTYKADWEDVPQPLVHTIDTQVDLYPNEGRAEVAAEFSMHNASDAPIDRMIVAFPDTVQVRSVQFSVPYTEQEDDEHGLSIWTLQTPIEPGAEVTLAFTVTYLQQGMPNEGYETLVVPNGTMLHHYLVFPSFGYERNGELGDPADRRKYDLPERKRMRDLDDPRAREFSYISNDAQRIDFTARVSTVAGQIPMAPGDLIDQGTEGDRVWRTYHPRDPALYLFAFLSADWEMKRSDAGRVPVEVYYDRKHPYNVDRMLQGMNASVAMFERDFGPFQHDILRIIEFPRYSRFAQSLPAMVPFSESIGFIASLDDPEEDIDYVYYVTAHEVAHQWWAHQVCGGAGQGATVLTESMSQYSALKVMEAEYGPDKIQKFLEYEADRYFRGRSNERDEELPLMRVENQQYIHYQKGGIVLYTLSERIGRTAFDAAIRSFLERWRLIGPPYPTARDFVEHLKASFPEHIDAIEDGFERIVRVDLRLESATYTLDDGVNTTLKIKAERLVADGEGREERSPLNDTVTVQLEDAGGQKTKVTLQLHGDATYEVSVPQMKAAPVKIVLDPRALLLEKDRDDNKATPELAP